MLTVTKPAEKRIDIELRGTIDAETMRSALDDLIEMSEGIIHGRMLYTIPEFAMPTLEAIGVEFTRLPKLFSLLGRFDKCAVLSDAIWLRTAAEVEGALFPGIEIRSFELDAVEAAEAWLAED